MNTTIRCVEPAAVGPHNYLAQADNRDELLFPHVDSCLAIAFLLNNDHAIGGHVGMMMPGANNLNPHGNAIQICNQMQAMIGNAQVSKVILIGDANWENDPVTNINVVQAIINQVGCPDTLFVDTGAYGGGVDFSLNPRRSMLFVQRCTGDRALVYQRPYAVIVGHQTEVV